jgi:hypothetical protein
MSRIFWMVAALSVVAVALVSTPAWACGGEGSTCQCQHAAGKKAEASKADAKSTTAEKKDAKSEASSVDEALAGKCSCSGAADCTCKKGECKCPKCGGKAAPMFDSLKGTKDALEIPKDARNDATAGVFI